MPADCRTTNGVDVSLRSPSMKHWTATPRSGRAPLRRTCCLLVASSLGFFLRMEPVQPLEHEPLEHESPTSPLEHEPLEHEPLEHEPNEPTEMIGKKELRRGDPAFALSALLYVCARSFELYEIRL